LETKFFQLILCQSQNYFFISSIDLSSSQLILIEYYNSQACEITV